MSVHIRIRYSNGKPTFQKIFNIVESKQAKKRKKRKSIQDNTPLKIIALKITIVHNRDNFWFRSIDKKRKRKKERRKKRNNRNDRIATFPPRAISFFYPFSQLLARYLLLINFRTGGENRGEERTSEYNRRSKLNPTSF